MIRSHLRVAIIAPFRFPVAEPFVGGLEAHVWLLSRMLRDRGHQVTLFAAHGSDRLVADRHYPVRIAATAAGARRDVSLDPTLVVDENLAYQQVMDHLRRVGSQHYDVVHNHSLHPAPVAMAAALDLPVVSTLHTPPLRLVLDALGSYVAADHALIAVSRHTADSWAREGTSPGVILNGVNLERWRPGPGGGPLIWFGRLVPEKGPQLAIDAARRAGCPLDLAGPIIDRPFFDQEIAPRLGDGIRYLGHLGQQDLAAVVGRAQAALVTPRWDEPYGLVAAEALACGTPVAAFRRGGLPEVLTAATGRLAPGDDINALAGAIHEAVRLSRRDARRRAVRHLSARTMIDAYERVYRSLITHAVPVPASRRGDLVDSEAAG